MLEKGHETSLVQGPGVLLQLRGPLPQSYNWGNGLQLQFLQTRYCHVVLQDWRVIQF